MRETWSHTSPRLGITFTQARLANPRRSDLGEIVELLVDTGALYSVVPGSILERLGDGQARTSLVVFAPEGVTALLGVLALESLGLMVNPVTRELLPTRLFLAGAA